MYCVLFAAGCAFHRAKIFLSSARITSLCGSALATSDFICVVVFIGQLVTIIKGNLVTREQHSYLGFSSPYQRH
jgi:hypothetical protein